MTIYAQAKTLTRERNYILLLEC